MSRVLAFVLAVLVLPGAAFAGDPHLKMPSFDHLDRSARESVNVTIGGVLMSFARFVLEHTDDPDQKQAAELLRGVESVYVRSYEFDADNMYSTADVDAVRAQLTGPGWSPLAQVKQKHDDEKVDVFVSLDQDKINGFAIIVAGARKLTIVNVIGTIDPEKLASMQTHLGLPGGTL